MTMINDFRQSLQHYAKGSNTSVLVMFTIVGLIAAALTFLYVYFFARHHQDNTFMCYLAPLLMFVIGVTFGIIARSKRGDWAAIGYAVLAVFFIFGALVGFVVTLILLLLVY
jgi:cytochrome bd-type quinol oxidase subunit 2